MRVSISLKGKEIDEISVEGTNGDLFYEASTKEYKGPSIVKEDLTFLGGFSRVCLCRQNPRDNKRAEKAI